MEGEKVKRSISIVVLGALFTAVVAGALTFSVTRLLSSKSALSTATAGATDQKVLFASSTASPSPEIAGTDHPVPVNSPAPLAASPRLVATSKYKTPNPPNPPATPVPQASALAENDPQNEAESPSEVIREKVEKVRERAERLRSRVEDLYQSRRISLAAYKQGQAEYQHQLAAYENQIAKLHGATGPTGTTNE
jgi:hypothetical protein